MARIGNRVAGDDMRMSDALWEGPCYPRRRRDQRRKALEDRPRLYRRDTLRSAHWLPVKVHTSNVRSAEHRY